MSDDKKPEPVVQGFTDRLVSKYRRTRRKLQEWDGEAGEGELAGSPRRLTRWLPGAIVLASLGAATMGWQASVADERATHKDELSRQDLVLQQQIRLQKTQEIDSDLRLFADVEQYSLLGRAMQHRAGHVGRGEHRRLLKEARRDQEVAWSLESQLRHPDAIDVGAGGGETYDVRAALVEARSGDPGLSSLEPNRLRAQAHAQRDRGLHLVGLAVLFVVALVFFTFAAVTSGLQSTADRLSAGGAERARRIPLVRLLQGPEAAAYWFASCGVCVFVATLILFAIVRF